MVAEPSLTHHLHPPHTRGSGTSGSLADPTNWLCTFCRRVSGLFVNLCRNSTVCLRSAIPGLSFASHRTLTFLRRVG